MVKKVLSSLGVHMSILKNSLALRVNKPTPKTPQGPVFSSDGHLVTDEEENVRDFNTYFSNVFTVQGFDNIQDPVIYLAGESTLTDIVCNEPEVETKLKELKPDKVASSGGFLPKVLKAVAIGVVVCLSQIFNRSLTTDEVSLDFGSADVCPIPKKGLLRERCNYRLIILTSVSGKVLESIIKDRVVNFLETNFITTSQDDIRRGRSFELFEKKVAAECYCTLASRIEAYGRR